MLIPDHRNYIKFDNSSTADFLPLFHLNRKGEYYIKFIRWKY